MSRKCLTVVFELTNDSELDEIYEALKEGVKYKGCFVTAMSHEDEISRVEKLEDALIDSGYDPDDFDII